MLEYSKSGIYNNNRLPAEKKEEKEEKEKENTRDRSVPDGSDNQTLTTLTALATLTTLITLNILTDQKIDQEDKYRLITLPCCIEGPCLV